MNRRTILVFLIIAAMALLYATGAPAEPFSEKVTLKTDRTVNVRSGPSTQHQQIGEAYPGVSFFFTGKVENGFFQILFPSASNDLGYVTAYVMQSLASVSPVSSQDTILSSSIGNVKVKQDAGIYLDAALSIKSKGKIGDYDSVPYAGVSSNGSYAVLLHRANDKGEEILWIGFVSPDDVSAEAVNDESGLERLNASGQWKYVLEGGNAVITGYEEEPTGDLAIPSEVDGHSVTGIGDYAFSYCRDLTGVTIPDSVTTIGANPFYGCALTSIRVSSGNPAFAQMDGVLFDKQLTTLIAYPNAREGAYTIPEGIRHIAANAFGGAKALTAVVFPDSVTSIGEGAFYECTGLTAVAVGNGVTSIGNAAFDYCISMTDIIIPDSVDSIGTGAFRYCVKLTDVALPASLTHISDRMFESCYGLVSMTIPDGITSIGKSVFRECNNLATVTIPESVTAIEENPFSGCPLTAVTVSPGNPIYEDIDGVLFHKNDKTLVAYPTTRQGEYIVPQGTVGIGNYAFNYCDGLTEVALPDSLVTIGSAAFYGCYELSQINLPKSLISIGGSAFEYCEKLTQITLPDSLVSIDGGAFSMSGLKKITLPESLASLGAYAFSESSLEQITFPDSLISINDGMFWRCESLRQVILPKSLVYIGDIAFMDCAISDITLPGSVFYIGRNAFSMYAGDITFHAPAGSYAERYAEENDIPFEANAETLPAINVFKGFAYVVNPDGKTITIREYRDKDAFQAVIPAKIDGMRVTDIGIGAFIDCALAQLTLPDTLVTIGDHAFRGCGALTQIALPDSVISIGDMAFYECFHLVQATLPDSVTYIGSNAFRRVDVLDVDEEHPDAAICAPAGSYAQQYAKDNGIPFIVAE